MALGSLLTPERGIKLKIMKVHYFLKDDSDASWYEIELVAWMETKGFVDKKLAEYEPSFIRVEHIQLSASKQPNYRAIEFSMETGKDLHIGNYSKTVKELIDAVAHEDEDGDPRSLMKPITKTEYIAMTKTIIEIYEKGKFIHNENKKK